MYLGNFFFPNCSFLLPIIKLLCVKKKNLSNKLPRASQTHALLKNFRIPLTPGLLLYRSITDVYTTHTSVLVGRQTELNCNSSHCM